MSKFSLSRITSGMIGIPYRLGGDDLVSGKRGHDCVTLLLEMAKKMEVGLPTKWQGYEIGKNRADFYKKDPVAARKVLVKWATSVGRRVDPNKAFAGDILIVTPKGLMKKERGGFPEDNKWVEFPEEAEPEYSVVIHAGQDQVLCVTEKAGVTLAPLRAFDVVKAFRWRQKRKRKLGKDK